MPADESDDEPPSVNRRSFLRATAATAAAGAGLTAASSTGSAYVECECNDYETSQCGPNERCVCEEIPGGTHGAGAHLGPLRQTRCVEIDPEPDGFLDSLPDCDDDYVPIKETTTCNY